MKKPRVSKARVTDVRNTRSRRQKLTLSSLNRFSVKDSALLDLDALSWSFPPYNEEWLPIAYLQSDPGRQCPPYVCLQLRMVTQRTDAHLYDVGFNIVFNKRNA
jgi:hypothetical protein